MKISVIDIGTNTVLMLVCNYNRSSGTIEKISEYFSIPRVGKSLFTTEKIEPDDTRRLIDTLQLYVQESKTSGSNQIFAFATYAFRAAKNANEIVQIVKAETGIQIETISAEIEGRFSFSGAVSGMLQGQSFSVIDIGGGSTEISFGTKEGLLSTISKPIGVVTLRDQFSAQNDNDFFRFSSESFQAQFHSFIRQEAETVIALAGTPTTLACIKAGLTEYNEEIIEGSVLFEKEIIAFINDVLPLSPEQISRKYKSVVAGRADLITAGAILLLETMKLLKTSQVLVSTRGLRYGAALAIFKNQLRMQ